MPKDGGDNRGGAPTDVVHMKADADGRIRYERRSSDGGVVRHDYRRPFILELELTWRCNLRCMHCYVDAAETARCNELTTAEIDEIITEAAGLGISELSLTGGEVLLRDDLPRILATGRDAGMGLRFVTNGTLLDASWIERLRPYPLKLVTVSLDAMTPAVHDAIRGTPCHRSVVAAIERLVDAGVPVSVITAFSRDNLDEFDGLLHFCIDHGIDWQVQMTSAKGRCPRDRVCSPDEYYDLGGKVAAAIAARPPVNVIPMDDLATFSRFAPLDLLSRTWQCGCSGGQLNLFIRADGSVTPCSAISFPPFVVGNIRETSLTTLCHEERCKTCLAAWLDVDALQGTCRRCPHRHACRGGCPEILFTMCDGHHENRYCYYRIEEERIRADLDGIW